MSRIYVSLLILIALSSLGCHAVVNPTKCDINVSQGVYAIPNGSGFFNFGNIPLNFSQVITFRITNYGEDDLELTGDPLINLTGNDADDFIMSLNLTSDTIFPSASTTFTVSFIPKSIGIKTAIVSIPSNDRYKNPYTFKIIGTCTEPAPEMHVMQGSTDILNNTGSYDFGTINAFASSSDVIFTIENNGNEVLNLTGDPNLINVNGADASMFNVNETHTYAIISPQNKMTFKVSFSPTSSGLKSATISIPNDDSDENPYTFTVTGTGKDSPEINVRQNSTNLPNGSGSYSFGEVLIEEQSPEIIFTVENLGLEVLHLTNTTNTILISGANPNQFILNTSSTVNSIDPSDSTTFGITFKPTSNGYKTAQIMIANDDPNENPYIFTITAVCITPEINVKQHTTDIPNSTGTYNFGTINIGSSSSGIVFTIENLDRGELRLTGSPIIEIMGTDPSMFIVDDSATSTTISNGNSTTFRITFNPTSGGNKSAIVSIANNDTNENPYMFTITGICKTPEPEMNIRSGSNNISCTTGTYYYGTIYYGHSSSDIVFNIENQGTGPLYLTGSPKVTISGYDSAMFSINDTATSGTVAPGSSTTFTIKFTPTGTGNKSAMISIINNDTDENPYVFEVEGRCEIAYPEIYVKQDSLSITYRTGYSDFGNIIAGETTRYKVYNIHNIGHDPLTLSGSPKIAISGTDAAMFTVNQSMTSPTVAPGTFTTFEIKFTPTSLGEKTATISITNNDGSKNPFTFSLKGNCINFSSGSGIAIGCLGGDYDGWRRYSYCPWGTKFRFLYNPADICTDSNGNIYIAEGSNPRISKWDKYGYSISWIGGGSSGWKTTTTPASDGSDYQSFKRPYGICLDPSGNMYIADADNHRISKWDKNGNAIGWIGGGSNGWKTTNAPSSGNDYQSFNLPVDVTLDAALNIYVVDYNNQRICKWDKNGNAIGWIGGGSNGWKTTTAPTSGNDYQSFHNPGDVFIDSSGNLYITDNRNRRVCKWDASGNAIGWFGGGSNGWKTIDAVGTYGEDYQSFASPSSILISPSGYIYVSDTTNHRVCKWTTNAVAIGWIGDDVDGWKTRDSTSSDYGTRYRQFHYPSGLFYDSSGFIYIADTENDRLSKWMD